jgi:outer membrane protein assembly factor BamB
MTIARSEERMTGKPLRLWPGLVLALLLCVARFGVPLVLPDGKIYGVLGGVIGALLILLWWLFFSRAPWIDRVSAILVIVAALAVIRPLMHESIATGMMGMMFFFYAIPVVSVALVIWAAATRGLRDGPRRAWMVLAILLACCAWMPFRTDGITGGGDAQFAWRWTKTHEQKLLEQTRTAPPVVPPPAPPLQTPEPPPVAVAVRKEPEVKPVTKTARTAEETAIEWPGFRGPRRDSVLRGVRIATDWSASPPVEQWRRPVGPGWSSFAVHGDLLYTQEQRGEDEIVSCYRVSTGEPVWAHRDAARFWESNAGAGPRGTPTLSDGHVYTFGATGIVNALDARTGAVLWSRNAASDTSAKIPGWGFASSPLVVDDLVIVAASGKLVAYEGITGKPRWFAQSTGGSYSSPHLLTIQGVPQVLLLTGAGATSFAPAGGQVLWQHTGDGSLILQPAVTADGDILMSTCDMSGGTGTRRITVTKGQEGWTVKERWTSPGLKPYFNDFVVHNGHAFGFDGRILSCIDVSDGKRKWKGGRYGNGQLMLLPDQNLLLVLSETGELALVSAVPDQFTELARLQAIEGKTWNHPVLAGNTLLVRNGEEMAAFRLQLAEH